MSDVADPHPRPAPLSAAMRQTGHDLSIAADAVLAYHRPDGHITTHCAACSCRYPCNEADLALSAERAAVLLTQAAQAHDEFVTAARAVVEDADRLNTGSAEVDSDLIVALAAALEGRQL